MPQHSGEQSETLIFSFASGSVNIYDVSAATEDGVAVNITVSPRSLRPGPDGFDGWRRRLVIRVKAPPLDGKANKEVEELMERITGLRAEITAGHTNRQKTVTIYGPREKILSSLEASL